MLLQKYHIIFTKNINIPQIGIEYFFLMFKVEANFDDFDSNKYAVKN
jgi:hypothetical protein